MRMYILLLYTVCITEIVYNQTGHAMEINQATPKTIAAMHIRTEIVNAMQAGNSTRIKELIAQGASIVDPTQPFGDTYVHGAKTISELSTILAAGADPDKPNRLGATPLHQAAYYGDIDRIKVLIAAGAKIDVHDKYHQTPAYYASENGRDDVILLLSGYAQRIQQAHIHAQEEISILARVTVERLFQDSPLPGDPFLMRHIAQLCVQAEEYEARQPRS